MRRSALLVGIVLATVTACGGGDSKDSKPSDGSSAPLAPISLTAADGAELPMRIWLPPNQQKPKAVILAVHGFNDYSNAFDMPGRWWAKHGIATYAYDQRGFGAYPELCEGYLVKQHSPAAKAELPPTRFLYVFTT